jgi:hypothetical protein
MKKYFLLILLLYESFFSQNTTGVFNDGFIFTNAIQGNPSSFLQSSNPWEVNIISTDVFLNNNYGYISKQNVLGVLGEKDFVVNDGKSSPDLPKNTIGFGVYKKFDGHFQADVLGPAIAVKFKIKDQDFAAGFYTRLRTFGNSFNLDGNYKYDNFVHQPSFALDFKPFSGSLATLQENNFFISKSFFQTKSSEFNIGLNFKHSKVWDALIVKEKNSFDFKYDKASATFEYNHYDVEALVTTSVNFDNNSYKPKDYGHSIGGDIGFTYVDYGDYDKEKGEYLQKLAFSVTDIGFIKVNGEKHIFKGDPFLINRTTDFQEFTNISDFLQELSSHVYGDPNASLVGTQFTVALPTALHLSYSGNLLKNRYVTLGINQRLPLYRYAFKTPNLFYVNLAKTHHLITYSAQLSLFEYKKPQLGAYLRFGPFFIGSDNILPVFFRQDKFNSFDVYFGFKIYPFWDSSESRRARKECYCDK